MRKPEIIEFINASGGWVSSSKIKFKIKKSIISSYIHGFIHTLFHLQGFDVKTHAIVIFLSYC